MDKIEFNPEKMRKMGHSGIGQAVGIMYNAFDLVLDQAWQFIQAQDAEIKGLTKENEELRKQLEKAGTEQKN